MTGTSVYKETSRLFQQRLDLHPIPRYHRTTEWLALKDLKDHSIPAPCHAQGHRPLDQAVQVPIQPDRGGTGTTPMGNCGSASPPP